MSRSYYLELFLLSMPIMLSSLSTTFINMASVPILGNYSVDAMAASAIAASIMMVLSNVFLASYTGFRVLGSKAYGAGDQDEINKYIGNTLFFAITVAVILMLLLFCIGSHVIGFMTQEEEIHKLSFEMIKINALSLPLNAISTLLLLNFGLQKKTKLVLYASLLANCIGIIISIILVYGYRAIPSYGAAGAAWAGFIESILMLLISLLFSIRYKYLGFLTKMQFDLKCVSRLFGLSYPMMFSMFIDYIGNFLMFSMISYYLGKESMSAGRLGFALLLLSFAIITSLSSGFMILGGRALGASKLEQFGHYYTANRNMLVLLAALLSLIIIAIPYTVLGLLTSFEAVQELAYIPIIIVAIICPFISISYSNASFLRLCERVKEDMYCNMFALWVIQLPLAYYLGVKQDLGLIGFFLAFLAYEIMYSLTTFYYKSLCMNDISTSIQNKIDVSYAFQKPK